MLGAVDWLREQGHARIGVLGVSMGGASTLLAAVDAPAIAALVVDSTFADFGEMIERQYRKLSHLPGFVLPGALAIGRRLTGVQLQRVRPLRAELWVTPTRRAISARTVRRPIVMPSACSASSFGTWRADHRGAWQVAPHFG